MNIYVIIPAYNEQDYIENCLQHLLCQTIPPSKIVVVDDSSSDNTYNIVQKLSKEHNHIQLVKSSSSTKEQIHMPGAKVINAFYKGYHLIDDNYDIILKLDADILLPKNYLQRLSELFSSINKLGIAGGFIYEKDQNDVWKKNHPMDKMHIRGAFKAYSKACFKKIGGLKSSIGWDTLDELLAIYHGFLLHTDEQLKVKHLRSVGKIYHKKSKYLQGKAMYVMGYGFFITLVASLKMTIVHKSPTIFINNLIGFFSSVLLKTPKIVTKEEGKFIRKYRNRQIFRKLKSLTYLVNNINLFLFLKMDSVLS